MLFYWRHFSLELMTFGLTHKNTKNNIHMIGIIPAFSFPQIDDLELFEFNVRFLHHIFSVKESKEMTFRKMPIKRLLTF